MISSCYSDPDYKTARNEAEGDVYRFPSFLTKIGVNSNRLCMLHAGWTTGVFLPGEIIFLLPHQILTSSRARTASHPVGLWTLVPAYKGGRSWLFLFVWWHESRNIWSLTSPLSTQLHCMVLCSEKYLNFCWQSQTLAWACSSCLSVFVICICPEGLMETIRRTLSRTIISRLSSPIPTTWCQPPYIVQLFTLFVVYLKTLSATLCIWLHIIWLLLNSELNRLWK
jgi:hypothetical protein